MQTKRIEISSSTKQLLTKACILAEDGFENNVKGKIIEAKNIFKRFIDKEPTDDNCHYNYANTLSRLGEPQEAIKHYKISLNINPNKAQTWKNLGSVYFDVNNHEEEMLCYDKALRLNPKLSEALFSKGITLSKIYNKHEEALTWMLKAYEEDENMFIHFPHSCFWLAHVNERLGNLEQSLSFANRGLEFNPEDIYLLNFKSNFLASHWKEEGSIEEEALDFFQYRLELENDLKSLYFY